MRLEHNDLDDALQFKTADEIRQIIPDWNLGSAWIDATQTFGGSGLREPREAGEICLLIVPLRKGQAIADSEPPHAINGDLDYAVGAYIQDDVDGSHGFIDLVKTAKWAASPNLAFPEIPAETVSFFFQPVLPTLSEAKELLYEVNHLLHVQTSDSVFGIGEDARKSWDEFAERLQYLTPWVGCSEATWSDIGNSCKQARSKEIKGRLDSDCWLNVYVPAQDIHVSFPVDYTLSFQNTLDGGYAWRGDIHASFGDSTVSLESLSLPCSSATEAVYMTPAMAYEKLDLGNIVPWISYEAESAITDGLIAEWLEERDEESL